MQDNHRVSSEIFVGRKDELNYFREFLFSTHQPVLFIYGEGGIGKTKLLLRMQRVCEEYPKEIIYTKRLIDFYCTEARTKLGIMHTVVQYLGENHFQLFNKKFVEYNKSGESSNISLSELYKAFYIEYAEFSKQANKKIILFFDTYEIIEKTGLSCWMKEKILSSLDKNTSVVIAGRNEVSTGFPKLIEQRELYRFDISDTINFLKKCFKFKTESALEKRLGSHEIITRVHELSGGRPVLLSLFADWCCYEDNPLNPSRLVEEIDKQNEKETGSAGDKLFEAKLIERIRVMKEPEDMAVSYMAFAYRRMTPEMFTYITGISLETSNEILLEKLKPLSFIKYKEELDTVLLHDEMRELVRDHWWDKYDSNLLIRKSIAEKLVTFYNKLLGSKLSRINQAVICAEKLYYQLYADFNGGFKFFKEEFDKHLDDYQTQYQLYNCELLLQEILSEDFYNKLQKSQQMEVDSREMSFHNAQYHSEDALKVHNKIEADSEKKTMIEKNETLLADFQYKLGVAYLWNNEFKKAIHYFSESNYIFKKVKNSFRLAWGLNLLGYANYRSGNLKEAENVLNSSIEEFIILPQKSFPEIDFGISNAYSNLNPVLRFQGRFYEAANHGEIAVAIAEKYHNHRELARFLIPLGEVYTLSNNNLEASKAYEDAIKMLASTPDSLLLSRSNIYSGLLLYKHADYIYLLECYQRGGDRQEALIIFLESYLPSKELFKNVEDMFEYAITLLESEFKQKTRELADLYFYYGQYYTVSDQWEKSIKYYKKSEEIARKINVYRETNAIAGQIIAYYHMDKDKTYQQEIKRLIEQVRNVKKPYHNLLGKMEIILGNFSYEQYTGTGDEKYLEDAVTRYVIACDHMYAFSQISRDRFYATLRIIAKRMNDLELEQLPSAHAVESLRNIWCNNEKERAVSKFYSEKLNEIIDFTLERIQIGNNIKRGKEYIKYLKEIIIKCIVHGKENLPFAPIYAEMLHRLQSDFGTPRNIAEAYYILSKAYFVNDNNFEAHKNIVLAFDTIKKTNSRFLRGRILIRLGTYIYSRGEYAKIIEHYRQENFKDNIERFKQKNRHNIDKSLKYYTEAEKIFDNLFIERRKERKRVVYFQALLQLRWAQYLIVTNGEPEDIETRIKLSLEKASSINHWRQMNAIECLITYYYLSGQWEQNKSEIEELRSRFNSLSREKYRPGLMSCIEITEGNAKYDQISLQKKDESLIKETFTHYIKATRHKANYSNKLLYEAVGTLLDRIAKLPKESVRILKKAYPGLEHERPKGCIADQAYKLVEQCINIHSEVL